MILSKTLSYILDATKCKVLSSIFPLQQERTLFAFADAAKQFRARDLLRRPDVPLIRYASLASWKRPVLNGNIEFHRIDKTSWHYNDSSSALFRIPFRHRSLRKFNMAGIRVLSSRSFLVKSENLLVDFTTWDLYVEVALQSLTVS